MKVCGKIGGNHNKKGGVILTTNLLLAQTNELTPTKGLDPKTAAEAKTVLGAMGFLGLILFISFVLWIWALIHIIRNDNFKDNTTKILWAFFVFFIYGIGPIIYLLFGRPKKRK